MATFKYPAITGLDIETKLRFLVPASFDPPWLPVDSVDMNNRQARGLVLAWRDSTQWVFDWKVTPSSMQAVEGEPEEFPPVPWDFAWCPLTSKGAARFRRWLPIP